MEDDIPHTVEAGNGENADGGTNEDAPTKSRMVVLRTSLPWNGTRTGRGWRCCEWVEDSSTVDGSRTTTLWMGRRWRREPPLDSSGIAMQIGDVGVFLYRQDTGWSRLRIPVFEVVL
jgi:hypothetical protein